MILKDTRPALAPTALWLITHGVGDVYSEGSQRMSAVGRRFISPIVADCSAFFTVIYNWAGAPDPNHLDFDHEGFTGTLLSAGEHVSMFRKNGIHKGYLDLLVGDAIVFGPGDGRHVVMVIDPHSSDPLVASFGHPGDPGMYRASEFDWLGERTYLEFATRTTGKIHYPPGYKKPATARAVLRRP